MATASHSLCLSLQCLCFHSNFVTVFVFIPAVFVFPWQHRLCVRVYRCSVCISTATSARCLCFGDNVISVFVSTATSALCFCFCDDISINLSFQDIARMFDSPRQHHHSVCVSMTTGAVACTSCQRAALWKRTPTTPAARGRAAPQTPSPPPPPWVPSARPCPVEPPMYPAPSVPPLLLLGLVGVVCV